MLRSKLIKFEKKSQAHEQRANLIMDFKAPLIKGIIKDVISERTKLKLNTKSSSETFKGPTKKTLNICAT